MKTEELYRYNKLHIDVGSSLSKLIETIKSNIKTEGREDILPYID
jgi:hypothetical protein